MLDAATRNRLKDMVDENFPGYWLIDVTLRDGTSVEGFLYDYVEANSEYYDGPSDYITIKIPDPVDPTVDADERDIDVVDIVKVVMP